MRILIIGCGSIGKRHIRNLLSLKAGDIFAFDISRKKLREVKNISSSIKVFTDLDKIWQINPEIAFIAVPTALHVRYAIKAANNGCHLFIEKPLSNDMRRLRELINIVRKKKIVTFLGYNYRFNECLIRTKKLLEGNVIGKIISGRAHFGSFLPARHPGEDYRLGYGGKRSLGGGVVLDALSHHLDALIFLLQQPKQVFSYCCRRSELDIDVEDLAEVLIEFSGGEVISLYADFIQRPYKNTLELIGSKGTILCDFAANKLKYYNARKKNWSIFCGDPDSNKPYMMEIRRFIACVKNRSSAPADITCGRRQLGILMKIKKSSKIKKWVKV